MVEDSVITQRLRTLLDQSDLSTTTEKQLRKTLEAELGVDLTDRKALIRAEVESYLAEREGENGEEEEEEGEDEEDAGEDGTPVAPAKGAAMGSILSEPMKKFLGVESMPRPTVVKKLWEYIKANNLQDPSNKRNILLDEKLSTLFTAPLSMFSINKQLSRHCKTADAADDTPRPPKPAKRPADKVKVSKAKKAKEDKPKSNGFQKPCKLSEALAQFVGKTEISRPELTKYFYDYFKTHNLYDPSNKQFVLADAKLKALLGQERFKAFGFQTHIKQHIL